MCRIGIKIMVYIYGKVDGIPILVDTDRKTFFAYTTNKIIGSGVTPQKAADDACRIMNMGETDKTNELNRLERLAGELIR